MNKFYTISKILQWIIALIFLIAIIIITLLWLKYTDINIMFYLLIIILVPISQFLATPFLRLIGVYEYLSPMLLVFTPNNKKYEIHIGTSFDYLFVMNNTKAGIIFRHKILIYTLEGLLEIIERIESNQLPKNILIKGSSYFFSDTTARSFGFKISKSGLWEILNIILNSIDLIWMYSVAHKKLRIPNYTKIRTAQIYGYELITKRKKIENLHQYLVNRCN